MGSLITKNKATGLVTREHTTPSTSKRKRSSFKRMGSLAIGANEVRRIVDFTEVVPDAPVAPDDPSLGDLPPNVRFFRCFNDEIVKQT
jgi:hypothetical protein